jgi:hypothetical protein
MFRFPMTRAKRMLYTDLEAFFIHPITSKVVQRPTSQVESVAAVSFHISVWTLLPSGPIIGVVQYPVILVSWLVFLDQETTVATLRLKKVL